MGLSIEDLTLDNWSRFKQKILESESIFQESIRMSSDEAIRILSSKNHVAKVALLDSEYIGIFLGTCPSKEEIEWFELEGIVENPSSIYQYNFVINPEHQNKGYGQKLLHESIKTARELGYKILEGHFRQNASLHIAKKLGAEEISVHKNWADTGEDYVHCQLDMEALP